MTNRIKQLRKQKNLLQKDFAKDFNDFVLKRNINIKPINFSVISKWETNKSEPTKATYKALAEYFKVSETYLKGAYSKEEIAEIVQQEYKRQYDSKNRLFPFIVTGLSSTTVDDYFISIGVIPYDIKQESFLLDKEQVNNLDFWINNLKLIYDITIIKWLLEKPTLNASKSDVLAAVNNAMDSIINKSSTVFVNPWLSRNHDNISDEQYFAKRLKFINDHIFYEEETLIDDNDQKHVEVVPYIDWNKTNDNN